MKKKIILLIVILALFIPTLIAVGYYINAQNAPVAERTVEKLTVTDLDGNVFVFDKSSKESKEMISFFIGMNNSAKQINALPDQLKGAECYEAVYRSFNKDKVYKYYFTDNPNEAYYVDARNKTYSINSDKAVKFLSMKYSESSFEASKEPELTVSNQSVLEPVNIDWKYKAGAGEFISTSYTGKPDINAEYPVSGSLQLAFSEHQPDYVTVKIMQGDEVIFDDLYENLTTNDIGETNKKFNIEVNAKWYESADNEFYGEALYKFTANVSAPAYFYLGEDTIEHGEFVVLTGKNILDINSIVFKSEPSINYTPKFYQEGDFVVALIPVSIALEYSPSYKFTVSSGGVTEEFNLNVTERAKKSNIYSKAPATLVNRTRTQAALDAFSNALKSTVNTNESVRYWDGVFSEPVSRLIRWGFGRTIVVSSTATQFVNQGVDYVVNAGDLAVAVNKGKVVYVGEQVYSGKLVVVDHGYGLKSWYMTLSSISVKVGDIVEKGGELGIVGDTGFTNDGVNLHYELTINGVPVCPYPLNEEGIKMYVGEKPAQPEEPSEEPAETETAE